MTVFLKIYLFFLSGFFLCQNSWAAFSNTNSILIGDQAAGMGGAATALVGDVASAAFYNPATLGALKGGSFSANVGIYKKFDTNYGYNQELTQAPLKVNQGFFRSLPASAGSVIDYKENKIGLSIVVPDYDTYKGDLAKTASNTSTLTYTDESLWVGLSIGRRWTEASYVGLTSYYTARSYVRTINDRSYPTATQAILYNQEKNITENGILFILGYLHEFSPRWKLGVSLRPPPIKVAGQANISESLVTMDQSVPSLTRNEPKLPTFGAPVKIPSKLGLGLSFSPNLHWLLSWDIHLYEGLSFSDIDSSEYSNRVNYRSIINTSLGVQWSLRENFKLRSGVFTNFSAHSNPDEKIPRLQEDRVDMLGFSANAVFIAENKVAYTFGGYYTGGRGRSIQRINQEYQVVPKDVHVFTMLVGTHFYF